MTSVMTVSTIRQAARRIRPEIQLEEQLVERYIRGDESVFVEIVTAYQGYVAGLAYRLLGWPGDVEDVVQEVFLAVFRNLRKFRGESSLKTWLTTITVNKCRSWRRKHLLKMKLLKIAGREKQAPPTRSDQGVMNRETFDRVRRTLQRMPGQYREVMVLHYLEEMPITEVAEVLGLKRNVVDVRLSRARARMREKLGDLIEK